MFNQYNFESWSVVCIYHGNCADGFGAAWSVRNALGDGVEFIPGVYGEDLPEVSNKFVVLVDFSYHPDHLKKLRENSRGVLIIDHHKSAYSNFLKEKEANSNFIDMSEWSGTVDFKRYLDNACQDVCEGCHSTVYGYFDMNRSGARMAWDFFNQGVPPALIDYIQDRDLWRFELSGTREIQAALFSYSYDFVVWDELMRTIPSRLAIDGEAIERKHFKDIEELIKLSAYRDKIGGHNVPVLNCPYFFSSDAGYIMAKGESFAACYYDRAGKRVYSLRSTDQGVDVSEIAAMYGGGGHRNAAGFSIDAHLSISSIFNESMDK